MKLRDYQASSVDNLRAAYARGIRSLVYCLPTGGGKTPVIAHVANLAVARGNRVLIVAGLGEILEQIIAKLGLAGITDIRVIQADRDEGREDAPVVVASIQTLVTPRWLANPIPADFLVLDECHHGAARTWSQFLQLYPKARILGTTATPQRGDGRALTDFEEIVVGASVRELTELGYLVPAQVFAPPSIMGPRELAMDPLDAYLKYTPDQRAIVFCETVKHALAVADSFTRAGIASAWVSGASKDRAAIVENFAQARTRVLVNVNLFVEGVDVPDVSAGIIARKFAAVGPWLQACGRFLRPAPNKTKATIVDLRGSALVHGTPDLERTFTLDGKGITREKVPLRQCGGCGGVYCAGARRACVFCGHELPALARSLPTASDIDLAEVKRQQRLTMWRPIRSKRRSRCASCGSAIEPGDWILWRPGQSAVHPKCGNARKAA